MKVLRSLGVAALSLCVIGIPATSTAQGKNQKPDKAKEVVDRIREADPPKTGTKKESAEKISKDENAKQKARDKETAKKNPPIKKEPPAPKTESKDKKKGGGSKL